MGLAESITSTPSLRGQLSPPPRAPWATVLLAISGLLVAAHGARLLARLVLAFRQPAEVRLTEAGIVIHTRTEMLGRPLSDRENLLPRGGLVRATRDVRFPSVAMYAGLTALALGSYVGVGLAVDGVRAASGSMFGAGALIALVGLGLDFALASLLPGTAGKCRVVFVPRRGRIFCIAGVAPGEADQLLADLAGRKDEPRTEPIRTSLQTLPRVGEGGRADEGAHEAEDDSARHA
jgi:hypothetical protein